MMKRAVFLDRDGVINECVVRNGKVTAPWSWEEFEILPGVKEGVRYLNSLGLSLFVVTNQPDIPAGFVDTNMLVGISQILCERFFIDQVVICPHEDWHRCACRKPKPGMLHFLAVEWGICLEDSFVVGDTWRDIEAGRSAGCKTVLVRNEYNIGQHGDYEADGLKSAAHIIGGIYGFHK